MASPITLTNGQNARIKDLINKHVLAEDGYLKPLMDRVITHLQGFMEELDDARPLILYDAHGNILQRPDVPSFDQAIVLVREGLDGDQFHIIVPPPAFSADYIGPVGEQKQAWGNGFHTAYIATRRSSFFEALAISLSINSRNELASIVRKLDPEVGPARIIADAVRPEPDADSLRRTFARWLLKHHPAILLAVLEDIKQPLPSESLSIATKPHAPVTDEEISLALHYLERDDRQLWIQGIYYGQFLNEQLGSHLDTIVEAAVEGRPAHALLSNFKALIQRHPAAAQAVNMFYANQDTASTSAILPADEDPHAPFKGLRDIPLGNFLHADTRALPFPQVDFRLVSQLPALGKLPTGFKANVAVVGGGPASAFAAVQWARIANYSGADIELSIFETVPDRNILGRFNSHLFPGGALMEHGAMRFVAAGPLYWYFLSLLYGFDASASTFPNHHVMNSRFLLHHMFGERGAAQDGTTLFEQYIEPVVKYVMAEFASISVEVDGETITYQDIESFLIDRSSEGFRTPNRAATILQAALLIDEKYRESYGADVLRTVEKGIRTKAITIEEDTWKRLFSGDTGRLSAGDVAERDNVVKFTAQKYLEVGKGTGGWGSYFDMSVFQEAITRSINSTEEFTMKQQTHGVQEIGALARDFARALGGPRFRLNMRWGARVEGLGKGYYDPQSQVLSKSALIYRELDPCNRSPIGAARLREFDAITTTVSPAVLAKTVAPQMGGTGGKVSLTGMDALGHTITKIFDDPFRVHPQDEASLDRIHPQLKLNNNLVWSWANFTRMFGTTKLTWEVMAELYDQVSPRDPHYPGMTLPVVPDIPARWLAIPEERVDAFTDSTDFTFAGQKPAVSCAAITHRGRSYKFMRISRHRAAELPKHLTSLRGPDGRYWLPVSADRIDEFGGQQCVSHHYPQHDPISMIDGEACIWLPVSDVTYHEMEEDDPIILRFREARLVQQRATTFVVPKSWTDATLSINDQRKLLSVKTRSNGPGFYITVPQDRVEDFEEDLDEGDWRLTDHGTSTTNARENDIYRLRSDGDRVGGLQVPGGTRNFYVIPSPDGKTIGLMEYNWDRDGNKLGAAARSFMTPDTASLPVERLGHANSFLFGGMPNPIRILTDNALSHATMNYMVAENYLGAFAMLGPGDAPLSFAVFSFPKLGMLFRYNPENYCPPCVIPSGEAVSMNAGWINPALMAMSGAIVGHLVMFGAELGSGVEEMLMGAPPFFSIGKLPGSAYPSFGLAK